MFIHSVYFSLRDDLTSPELAHFSRSLDALCGIDGVQHAWTGVPADTDRPVIERGYSWALILVFADEAAHDAYQVDPVHDRFRAECGGYWHAVRIYDAVSDARA